MQTIGRRRNRAAKGATRHVLQSAVQKRGARRFGCANDRGEREMIAPRKNRHAACRKGNAHKTQGGNSLPIAHAGFGNFFHL
jgi:hypothetical protein